MEMSQIQNPKSKIQNPKSKIQNPKSKMAGVGMNSAHRNFIEV
jgi:hypothetical protein